MANWYFCINFHAMDNSLTPDQLSGYERLLTDSLKQMAMSFEEQRGFLPVFVDVPFEVVDDYEHAFRLLPALIEAGYFSREAIAAMIRLSNYIQHFIVGHPRYLELKYEDFPQFEEWHMGRILAKETLQLLEEIKKP